MATGDKWERKQLYKEIQTVLNFDDKEAESLTRASNEVVKKVLAASAGTFSSQEVNELLDSQVKMDFFNGLIHQENQAAGRKFYAITFIVIMAVLSVAIIVRGFDDPFMYLLLGISVSGLGVMTYAWRKLVKDAATTEEMLEYYKEAREALATYQSVIEKLDPTAATEPLEDIDLADDY